jgi:RHS repeat-associated protein
LPPAPGLAAPPLAPQSPATVITNCTEAGLDAALAQGGSLTFSCGGPVTITLTSTKVISQDTALDGASQVTLSGSGTVRLFRITGNVDVTLANLTLRDGYVPYPFFPENGGAILNTGRLTVANVVFENNQNLSGRGGAIFSDFDGYDPAEGQSFPATLTISDSTFISNTAPGGGNGGAVFVRGSLSITGTTFLENAANNGGAVYIEDAGGDTTGAVVTIYDSQFGDNHATYGGGGGIYYGGTQARPVTLDGVTFTANTSTGFGGGAQLTHYSDVPKTSLQVLNSHFDGNTARWAGGGLYAGPAIIEDSVFENNSTTWYGGGAEVLWDSFVTRSTFRSNSVETGDINGGGSALKVNTGPAIVSDSTFVVNEFVGSYSSGGTILFENLSGFSRLENNTLTHNTSTAGASVLYTYAGGITLTHNTIANNVNLAGCTGECYAFVERYSYYDPLHLQGNILDNPGALNCKEALDSLGHNLFSDVACGPVASDLYSTTAQLAPLADYGGPSQTRMPYTDSPARDNAGTGCPATDQRGVSRPVGAACDIGAVEADAELEPPPPPIPPEALRALSYPSQATAPSQRSYRTLALGGDPVNAIFGNFTYEHTDLALPVFGPPVRLHRTYNSAAPQDGILGWGWNLAYNLRVSEPTTDTVTVTRGDGRVDTYTLDGNGDLIPPAGSADSLVKHPDDSYTLTTRERIVYEFSSGGQLQSAADPDGNTITLSYTGGQWTAITDAAGRAWSLAYNAEGRVSLVTDPAGRSVTFAYSPAGDLTSVTNAAGGITTYQYDSDHRLTQITDANGHLYLAHAYDETGRVAQQMDARGSHSFAYFTGYTLYTDPVGTVHRIDYDGSYRLTSRVDGYGTAQAVTTTLAYDGAGLVAAHTDGNGTTTDYEYDARGNVTHVTDPLGGETVMTFDGRDNLLTRADPLGHTFSWTYSSSNHPLSATDALGQVTEYQYDSRGLLTALTDALDNVTAYSYDANGNLTAIQDPLLASTTLSYDAVGRLSQQTDPLGHTAAFTYNALNLRLSETAADGGVTTYTYDAVGNTLSVSDPLGAVTSFAYDEANDLVQVTDALGQVTAYDYDALGRETARTLPDGTTWLSTYDALSRLTAVTSPLGHATQFAYDGNGNLTSVTDAAGATTTYHYDALDRLVGVTDALGGQSTYGYDAAGHLLSITDPLAHTTTYAYDALGRRLSATDPLGHVTSASYDALSRLGAATNGAGQTVNYTYDPLGRLLSASGPGVSASFSYDAAGNRMQMVDGIGATTYAYDAANRLATVDGPHGLLSYTYDLAGRRTGLSQPGAELTYSYDALGRLTALHLDGGPLTGYAYDAVGNVVEQIYGNGLVTDLNYDADRRLVGLETRLGATLVQQIAYQRDARGNVTAETATGFSAAYAYDELSRLTSAVLQYTPAPTAEPEYVVFLPLVSRGGAGAAAAQAAAGPAALAATFTFAFTYDAAGNRLTATENGATTTYAYDGANHLSGPGFTYDGTGRLTSDGTTAYNYDALGRLIGAGGVSYAYDGDGNRVRATGDGTMTDYLLDVALPLPTRVAAASGGVTERWFFGSEQSLVAGRQPDGTLQYAQTDALGSVRLVSSAAGTANAAPLYAPFGACVLDCTGFGFAGEPLDGGLVHLRARDYHPSLGRFLTPDPLGPVLSRGQGLNAFSYVENNPVNHTDPSGLCWLGPVCGAGQFIVSGAQAVGNAIVSGAQAAGSAIASVGQRLAGTVAPAVENSRVGSGGLAGQVRYPLISDKGTGLISDKGVGLTDTGGSNILSDNGLGFTSPGSSNVIGAGGGNAITADPSKLLGNGSTNVIAAGGGNILISGRTRLISDNGAGLIGLAGGNVIGAGGGN